MNANRLEANRSGTWARRSLSLSLRGLVVCLACSEGGSSDAEEAKTGGSGGILPGSTGGLRPGSGTWIEHEDINSVMLATALSPPGCLAQRL